jgi:energy-coupling factor transporter transmembrane protein EcfT
LLSRTEPGGPPTTDRATPAPRAPPIDLPFIGRLDPSTLSLPVLTLVLAGLDAFNPCAFFVLLFLLSLMVHARSRARMALVGGVFVLFSGLLYFVFMAAWLNLFLLVGYLPLVTISAGLVALFVGALNVKDFVWPKKGISLSIPERAKPDLYQRTRDLVGGLIELLPRERQVEPLRKSDPGAAPPHAVAVASPIAPRSRR